jgi:fructokinase
MRRIYTIGETVYDIIFDAGEIRAGKVGGSMLNASVSLGRMHMDVGFISELGDDDLGELVLQFLADNNVNPSWVHQFKDGKTPIALAFLDHHQNANYSFYKSYPKNRLQQTFPVVRKNDIVLFGSFFAVNAEVRERVLEFIVGAKNAGAIVIYDPNIRHPRNHEMNEILKNVHANFALADIVRASHDDFNRLFGVDDPKIAKQIIRKHGNADLIFTHSSRFVYFENETFSKTYNVPQIDVLSTIGAGDNFNAGIIYAMMQNKVLKDNLKSLDEKSWEPILKSGIHFSQQVCQSLDNYIPRGFKSYGAC